MFPENGARRAKTAFGRRPVGTQGRPRRYNESGHKVAPANKVNKSFVKMPPIQEMNSRNASQISRGNQPVISFRIVASCAQHPGE
jgi:hypothetical protein